MLHPGHSAFLFWRRGVKRGGYLPEMIFVSLCFMELGGSSETPQKQRGQSKVLHMGCASLTPVPTPSTEVPLTPILSTRLLCDFILTKDFTFFKYIKTPTRGHLKPRPLLYLHSQQSGNEEAGRPPLLCKRRRGMQILGIVIRILLPGGTLQPACFPIA